MRLNVTLYRVMAHVTGVILIVLCVFAIAQAFTNDEAIVNAIGTVHGLLYIVYLIVSYPLTRRLRLPVLADGRGTARRHDPGDDVRGGAPDQPPLHRTGAGRRRCAFTRPARFVFILDPAIADTHTYGDRLPRRAQPAGVRPPRRRGARAGELLARLRARRGPRLPLPGDRPPGDRGRRAGRVPRPDPDPGLRPRRPGMRGSATPSCPPPGSTAPSRSRCWRTCSPPGPTCGSTST